MRASVLARLMLEQSSVKGTRVPFLALLAPAPCTYVAIRR